MTPNLSNLSRASTALNKANFFHSSEPSAQQPGVSLQGSCANPVATPRLFARENYLGGLTAGY